MYIDVLKNKGRRNVKRTMSASPEKSGVQIRSSKSGSEGAKGSSSFVSI